MNDYTSIGQDLVAMCANDVLCRCAEPVAFLDYYATGHLNVDHAASIINSVAKACKQINCALVGNSLHKYFFMLMHWSSSFFSPSWCHKNPLYRRWKISKS